MKTNQKAAYFLYLIYNLTLIVNLYKKPIYLLRLK